MVKNPLVKVRDIRDLGSIPGVGRFPGGGNGRLEAKRIKSPVAVITVSCAGTCLKASSLVGESPDV